jgi:hypothetical protein
LLRAVVVAQVVICVATRKAKVVRAARVPVVPARMLPAQALVTVELAARKPAVV